MIVGKQQHILYFFIYEMQLLWKQDIMMSIPILAAKDNKNRRWRFKVKLLETKLDHLLQPSTGARKKHPSREAEFLALVKMHIIYTQYT